MIKTINSAKGFSLVEMAVVLVIVGLLLSISLVPMSAQMDARNYAEAKRDVDTAKEALLGFLASYGRMPCPDVTGDGLEDSCPNSNSTASTSGDLPWLTLGLKSKDPWGQAYKYRVNNAFTTNLNFTTTPSVAGINKLCTDAICTTTLINNTPVVLFSTGKNGATLPVNDDEKENLDSDGIFVSHDLTSGASEFDDVVTWLSREIIINRLVIVGKLP